jgi:hypothetical protein
MRAEVVVIDPRKARSPPKQFGSHFRGMTRVASAIRPCFPVYFAC